MQLDTMSCVTKSVVIDTTLRLRGSCPGGAESSKEGSRKKTCSPTCRACDSANSKRISVAMPAAAPPPSLPKAMEVRPRKIPTGGDLSILMGFIFPILFRASTVKKGSLSSRPPAGTMMPACAGTSIANFWPKSTGCFMVSINWLVASTQDAKAMASSSGGSGA